MFYDALGSLLGQAGDAIERAGERTESDARGQREARQIGLLLRRTYAIWPRLFETLVTETGILVRGLEEVNIELDRRGLETNRVPPESDPLAYYRSIGLALDATIARLGERPAEDWSEAALASLRRSLAESAEVQGRLVDEMLKPTRESTARRAPATSVG
jgi:hypothetical protein